MKSIANILYVFVIAIFAPVDSYAENNIGSIFFEVWQTIEKDHKEYYSRKKVMNMIGAIGVGATIANTPADESFQNWYQNDVRSKVTNDISNATKNFGEYKYILSTIFTATIMDSLLQNYFEDSMTGDWGKRTMRAYIIGTPMLWADQRVIGASRPGENNDSNWGPLLDRSLQDEKSIYLG